MAFVAHPRLKQQAAGIAASILALNTTEPGQALLKAAQHESYVPLTPADLATVDPLVTEYYRQKAAN